MVEYMCGVQQDRNPEMTSSLFGLPNLRWPANEAAKNLRQARRLSSPTTAAEKALNMAENDIKFPKTTPLAPPDANPVSCA